MSSPKPAVKDVSITLLNAPREIMLGTKQYPLEFQLINFREEGDFTIAFTSDSLSLEPASVELHLATQEKQTITTKVSPLKDGGLDLAATIDKRVTVTWTEEVLEGHENEATGSSEKPPTAPVKSPAVSSPVSQPPVKPIKPAKVAGEKPPAPVQKPSGEKPPAPVQKPSGEKPPAPVQQDGLVLLQDKVMEIRERYMACRNSLQSLEPGSGPYKENYTKALELKEQYEKLSKIYESGGPVPEEILHTLVPATPDPVEELKQLMGRYNELKTLLATMDPADPGHAKTRQEAMDIYTQYNDKRTKAKEQGLIS